MLLSEGVRGMRKHEGDKGRVLCFMPKGDSVEVSLSEDDRVEALLSEDDKRLFPSYHSRTSPENSVDIISAFINFLLVILVLMKI